MHWLLQNNIFNEPKFDELRQLLDKYEIPNSVHKVVPFIGEIEPDFDVPDKNVICWGSYSMRHLAKKKGWTPGVYDLFEYDFLEQIKHWGNKMLNSDSVISEFRNVEINSPTFIRPIDDSKYFAGKLFDPIEFHNWKEKVLDIGDDLGSSLKPETLVQICKPKKIYQEVRFWIIDKKPVTASIYKTGSRVHYSDQVDSRYWEFAYSLVAPISVDCWNPERAFVLDICETPDGMRVVEINTINSSGFYAADLQKLIFAIQN